MVRVPRPLYTACLVPLLLITPSKDRLAPVALKVALNALLFIRISPVSVSAPLPKLRRVTVPPEGAPRRSQLRLELRATLPV